MDVSSCCGCCSLKAGAVSIGVLNIIGGVLILIATFVKGSQIFLPASAVVCFMSGVLLVIGANKRKSQLVFPSVCLHFVNIVLQIPESLILQLRFHASQHSPAWAYITTVIILVIAFAIGVYFFLVINSFYKELLHEKYAVSKIDNSVDMHLSNNQHQHHV